MECFASGRSKVKLVTLATSAQSDKPVEEPLSSSNIIACRIAAFPYFRFLQTEHFDQLLIATLQFQV